MNKKENKLKSLHSKKTIRKTKNVNHRLPDKKTLICISMAVIVATGGSVYGGTRWYLGSHVSRAMDDTFTDKMEVKVQRGTLTLGTTVSGTTEAGSAYQNFLLSFLEQGGHLPVVEEVYVTAGDTVEKGSALYKITKESIAEIETYLQEELKAANASYRSQKLQYASDLLNAKMEYAINQNLQGTAQDTYNSTVKALESEVESTKIAYREAKNTIAQNPPKISAKKTTIENLKQRITALEKTISTLTKKSNKKEKAENKALEKLEAAQQEYAISENMYQNAKQYLEQIQKEKNGTDTELMETYTEELKNRFLKAQEDFQLNQGAYDTAKKEAESVQTKLETKETTLSEKQSALSFAKETLENLQEELEEAEKNQTALKAAYDKAVVAKETSQVTAKQEYENNILTAHYAGTIYQSAKETLDETLQTAKEEVETAKEHISQWETFIGEGIIKANQAGEVTLVGYEADTYISAMIPLAVYYDGAILSVDVTVDQKDIGFIYVGEEISVSLNGNAAEGKVAAIATEKSESGASKVNYTVTVNIDNTDGIYQKGQTAGMTFVKEELKDVLYVQKQFVSEDEKGSYVWVKNGDNTEKTYVQTGEKNDTFIVITSGLKEGQTCVYVKEE